MTDTDPEQGNAPYIAALPFGTFALVVAPFALWLAIVYALEVGLVFRSRADEVWAVSSRRTSATSTIPLDDSTVVSMERSTCEGRCPAYRLRIYGSGKVEYAGERYVCAFGERTATADPREVRRLVDAMLAAGALGLTWVRGALITDYETVLTTLDQGGKRSFGVSHYHGDPAAPRWLSAMEEEIDRVAGSARWLPIQGDDWRWHCRTPDGQLRELTLNDPADGER